MAAFASSLDVAPPAPDQVLDDLAMADPLFGSAGRVKSVKIVKIFKSAAKPLLCELSYEDEDEPPRKFIFKRGDDLRYVP